jgi:hypothetical protein
METEQLLQMVSDCLIYDKDTGVFTWKKNPGKKIKAGVKAGTINQEGYVAISINRKVYYGHRLAFLFVYGRLPIGVIDHINQKRDDNRISNLREVTKSQNALNTSKTKGVDLTKSGWRVRFARKFLGNYKTQEEATSVFLKAKKEYMEQELKQW